MLLVVLLEDVLVFNVAEEHHRPVERSLDVVLRGVLEPFLELRVDEQRDVLGRPRVGVDVAFKGFGDSDLERLVGLKSVAEQPRALLAMLENARDPDDGVFAPLPGLEYNDLVLDQRAPHVDDVLAERLEHGLEPSGHPLEKAEH
eukprot:Amastigsp_a340643_24.p3 type:complete len:145 gc:universal Amastigsp_a340643_24:1386-952(-)